MHVCDDFREKISEQILDHRDLDHDVEVQRELLVCNECADFYAEAKEMVEALSSVHFEIADDQWAAMAERMNDTIRREHASRGSRWQLWLGRPALARRSFLPAFAGVAAVLLAAVGIYWLTLPLVEQTRQAELTAATSAIVDPSVDPDPSLDPITLQFLEQSELLLRSVMKLEPTSREDVEEARAIAGRQLIALGQRKHAAAELEPVVNAMNRYENILRDIRNLNHRFVADDIADIRNRIEKTGLIADMQSFQPRVSATEADLAFDK